MKVLITGATGLVGREIVKQCLTNSIAVNYLTTSKQKIVAKEGYNGFYWNPSHNEIDISCFNGVTVIINLAGSSIVKRWTSNNKKEILDSRINSLKTLHLGLSKVDTSLITSFVSASAIGIYPNSITNYYTEKEKAIDESFLGKVVDLWEKEVDTFKGYNFSVAKVRIGLVMAKNGGALPMLIKPVKYYVGSALGTGKQWQSWIHITDLARIFLFISNNKLEGVYNGVGPNPISNAKLVRKIASVLKKPVFFPNVPKFIMYLVLGKMAYLLFVSQRVSSKKIEKEGFVFKYSNVGLALEKITS
ncbi:hypothetical protein CLV91_2466 [Maribacter vaceletii]|uniref:TIGR01777 family protein n=1 Tax=Maribacter vaceletii TaxID=1206816 RepID=A0A495E600_9FLAO|nr:TIGR01777 family oxidoreductase [Maribacter vaceletii]RKR12340.1 hypothetical protein CLV91_2466 [Maribacter vaceletii]